MTRTAPSLGWPLAFFFALLALNAGAQSGLQTGSITTLSLRGGGISSLPLAPERPARTFVSVEQLGIDVVISVLDDSGTQLLRSNAAGERNATEIVVIPRSAAHLQVSAASPSASTGEVRVMLRAGQPSGGESILAKGHILFARGRRMAPADELCTAGAESGYAAAAQCYGQAAQRYPELATYARFLQADAIRASSDYQLAIEIYQEAEQLAHATLSRPSETLGAIYAGWGWSLSRQGNYDQARTIFHRAKAVLEDLVIADPSHTGHRYDLGSVANNLCLQDLRQDRLSEAETCLYELEELALASEDENLLLLTLNGLGGLHRLVGRPDNAIEYFERALRLAQRAGDLRRQALLHNNLGWTYRASSDYAKGIQHALEANRLSDQLEWSDQTALAQANLGRLYALVGDFDRAKHWYTVAIQGGKQARRLANRYLSLGNVELAQGNHQDALEAFKQAHEMAAALEAPKLQLAVADRLIRAQLALGHLDGIESIIEQAESVAKHVEDQFSLASYHLAVGEFRLQMGQADPAYARFQQALPGYQELGFSTGLANTYYGFARCADLQGNRAEALRYALQAIDELEATRARLWTLFERINFNRIGSEIYDFAIRLHMQTPHAESALQALLIAERRKAQTLSEVVRTAQSHSEVPATEAEQKTQSVRRRVSALQAQLLEVSGRQNREALTARLRSEYFAALDELQSAELSLAQGLPPSAREIVFEQHDLDELHKGYDAIISFFVGLDRSYAWRIDSAGIRTYELPRRKSVDQQVSALLDRFRTPAAEGIRRSDLPLVETLSEIMSEPGASPSRLLVSTDGTLSLVPFAALPGADGRPLVHTVEVTVTPRLGVGAAAAASPRPNVDISALVVADPVFSRSDRRLGPARSSERQQGGLALPRLAGTKQEAEVLAELVQAQRFFELSGLEATRDKLLDTPLERFDLLHFGTHGLLDRSTPDGYGLAMTRVSSNGTPVEWVLSIHDISRLRLSSDLVVLSGCDTAQGEQIDGAGIVGLTRAFMYAGSNQVMSSLWQVSDRSTAMLMKHFYQDYLGQHRSAAHALRQAQLKMLNQPGRTHPYHWAAFVVSTGSNSQ